jgi:hypothetical protein
VNNLEGARSHVRGNRGPRRNTLPTFERISKQVPDAVLEEARQIAYADASRNDLRTDKYKISVDCPLPDLFSQEYRQILLQEQVPDTDTHDEANYTVWSDTCPQIQQYMESIFGAVNRTRVTVLASGEELDWHIDTDTSVMCRVQIGVDVDGSEFQFNRKGKIESFIMDPKELWFINVGWSHRVVNYSDTPRIVIIAGVLHENLDALL